MNKILIHDGIFNKVKLKGDIEEEVSSLFDASIAYQHRVENKVLCKQCLINESYRKLHFLGAEAWHSITPLASSTSLFTLIVDCLGKIHLKNQVC